MGTTCSSRVQGAGRAESRLLVATACCGVWLALAGPVAGQEQGPAGAAPPADPAVPAVPAAPLAAPAVPAAPLADPAVPADTSAPPADPADPAAPPADPAAPPADPAAPPADPAAPQLVPPRLLEFVHADYPPAALQAGLQAAVKLGLDVDDAGRVTRVEVLEPAGQGFDEAAADAVRRFRFAPALLGGKPVGVTIRFTYRFTLAEQPRSRAAAASPEAAAGGAAPAAAGASPGRAAPGAQAAAPVTLRGQVRQRGDRTPLPEMGVRVKESGMQTQTDDRGRFALALPPGRWTIEVIHPSFEPYSTEEEIRPGEALEATYYAERRSTSRYRSVVRSQREKKTVTRTTLDEVELVQVPGTFGEPFRVVQTLPGVARSPFGTSMLLVRGAEPQDSAFFLDGHRLPDLYHFMSGPAIINAALVESIDFFPGNYPLSFGGKQAGIVTATTGPGQRPRPERVNGELSLDLLDAEGLVRIPVGAATEIDVAARRSHFDLFLPLMTDEHIRPSYWDYQIMARSEAGGWKGKLLLIGGADALEYEDEPDSKSDPGSRMQLGMGRDFHQLIGRFARTVLGDGTLSISPSVGTAWIDVAVDENHLEDRNTHAVLRAELRKPLLGERLVLNLGAEGTGVLEQMKMNVPGFPVFTDFPEPAIAGGDASRPRTVVDMSIWAAMGSVWTSLEWRLGPLLLIPGLRADAMHVSDTGFDDFVLDPRLIARLQLTATLWLKGGVGVYHQQVNGQVLSDEYGSPTTIDAPWALQHSLGAELQPLEQLTFEATGFYNKYNDLIVPGRVTESAGQIRSEALYTNEGEGRAYGLEVLLRHKPQGRFFGWVGYTLSRSERRQGGGDWSLFAFDQTHILSAVGSVDLGRGFTAGARFQLVTGIPRTPVTGSVYDIDTNSWTPIMGPVHSTRLPTFQQLDLRLDKLFVFDTWKMTVYLDIQNVYNHDNPEFPVYDHDYSQMKYINGLPILPSLGIKGEI